MDTALRSAGAVLGGASGCSGQLADLVVLDRNVFEHPLDQIAEANVLMATIAGETVFEAVSL